MASPDILVNLEELAKLRPQMYAVEVYRTRTQQFRTLAILTINADGSELENVSREIAAVGGFNFDFEHNGVSVPAWMGEAGFSEIVNHRSKGAVNVSIKVI